MSFSTANITTAFSNLKAAFTSIRALTGAVATIIGLTLIIKGIMSLRNHGQQGKDGLLNSIALITCGAALIYLPSTMSISLTTVFGTNQIGSADILSSYIKTPNQTWNDIILVIAQYMKLIGAISFIRGWVILSKIGTANSGQQHTTGKGITHIIGGVLLINFPGFAHAMATFFGVA